VFLSVCLIAQGTGSAGHDALDISPSGHYITEQYLGTPDRVKAQTEVRSNAVHCSYTALDRLTLAGYSIDDSNETFTIVEGPPC
jgi:hypothetical protein